jgi:ribulose-bisphosphate carboxylase small chain
VRLSFIVQRPEVEPSFELVREEGEGRRLRYSLRLRPAQGAAR